MICPKCGFEQQDAVDCLRCGIVIEKFRNPGDPVRYQAAIMESSPSSSCVSIPWNSLLRLTLLISIGLFSML